MRVSLCCITASLCVGYILQPGCRDSASTPQPPLPVPEDTRDGSDKHEALRDAIVERRTQDALKILQATGDIEVRIDRHGATPLMLAASANDADLVAYLLGRGVNVAARDDAGMNAVLYGVCEPSVQAVVAFGRDLAWDTVCDDSELQSSPLHYSVAEGDEYLDMSRALLELGHPVDRPNAIGYTPLMVAAMSGSPAQVGLLLDSGADVTVTGGLYNKSALDVAHTRLQGSKTEAERAVALQVVDLVKGAWPNSLP